MSNQIANRHSKLARSIDRPIWGRIKRERFLGRLQERYGYSKEKAKEELDRLMDEFYGQNKRMVRYLHPRRYPVE
jgi:hypothetical protein